jgi:hypothetical protein
MNHETRSAQGAAPPATLDANRLREHAVQSIEQVTSIEKTAAKPPSVNPQPGMSKTAPNNSHSNLCTPTKGKSQPNKRSPHNLRARRDKKQKPPTPKMSMANRPNSMHALWAAAKQRNRTNVCPDKCKLPKTRGFACKAWVLLPVFGADAENDEYVNRDEYELCS